MLYLLLLCVGRAGWEFNVYLFKRGDKFLPATFQSDPDSLLRQRRQRIKLYQWKVQYKSPNSWA